MWERRNPYKMLVGNLREIDNYEDLLVDGRIILKRILKRQGNDVDWIHLAHDRAQWRALVNTVINYQAHKILTIS
jgi:hypothetical protein